MRKFKDRVTKIITLLLVCSMISGSIPVQAYSVSENSVLSSEEQNLLEISGPEEEGPKEPEGEVKGITEDIPGPEESEESKKEGFEESGEVMEESGNAAEGTPGSGGSEETGKEASDDVTTEAENGEEGTKDLEDLEKSEEGDSDEGIGEGSVGQDAANPGEPKEEGSVKESEEGENSGEEILDSETSDKEILEEEPAEQEASVEEEDPSLSLLGEGTETFTISFSPGTGTDGSQYRIFLLDEYDNEEEITDAQTLVKKGEELHFLVEAKEGYRISEVKMGNSILKHEDGKYSVTPAGADTIYIATEELEKYDVTFTYDEDQVKDLKVNMGKKDVVLQDKVAADMLEESNVTFVVNLKDKMKVVKVIADGKELKPATGTTYVLEKISKDMEVSIETSLDPDKCNVLEIVVYGHRSSISVLHEEKVYKNGDRILTTDPFEEITVALDENYKVNQLKLNNAVKSFTDKLSTYSVNFSSARKQKLEITTTPNTADSLKKIVFANKSENISYEVNLSAPKDQSKVIVTKEAGKTNSYRIEPNEPTMEFTVKVKEGYELKLDFTNTSSEADQVLYDVTKKDNTYTYSVAVATLGGVDSPTEIVLEESPQIRTIDVFYKAAEIESILAVIDGKEIEEAATYHAEKKLYHKTFKYSYNKDLVLKIKTGDSYQVEEIKETYESGTTKKSSVLKNEVTYTIAMDKNKEVEIVTAGAYQVKIAPKENRTSYVEKENNLYPLEAEKEYIANLFYGKDSQTIKTAVLKSGSKVVDGKISVKDSDDVYFTIPFSEEGKTLTLELSITNGNTLSTTFVRLNVLNQGKITSITGVSNGKVSQEIDSVKEYQIKKNNTGIQPGYEIITADPNRDILTPKERERLDALARSNFRVAIIENKEGEIREEFLRITTAQAKVGDQAYIRLYDKAKSTEESKYYLPGGTILITAKEPAFMTKAPTVKLKNSTNLDLILDLTMKEVKEPEQGSVWYKITVTPKVTAKTEEIILENTEAFVVYRPYRKEMQTEQIRVVARNDEQITEGQIPFKADFEVKVSMVITTDDNAPSDGSGNIALASVKEVKQNLSTKAPIYETNLGIKMINSTIYSGQEELVMASPVFSKNTSYQKLTFLTPEGLSADTDAENNIIVSAEEDLMPGKYTIQVTAEAADETLEAKKEFTIQVVQGIYKIDLVSSKEIYKQYNKEASFTVEAVFNEGDKEKEPKKKEVEWFLLDADGNEIDKDHEKYEYFSIKNGVVTVAKDFLISGTEKENQIRVKAVAKDFERKQELSVTSDLLTITNRSVNMGELILVKEKSQDPGRYQVMARSNNTVSLDKVHGSKAVILKKGTPEREEYVNSDFISNLENIRFTTSDEKLLVLEADQQLRALNTGKKLSITAKAMDGSKRETSLKELTIELGKPADLGLTVTNLRSHAILADSYADEEIEFYGLKDEKFLVSIKEKRSDGSEYFYGGNHQLKVEGAKIVESDTVKGEYTLVGTSEIMTLRLINNATKVEEVFILRNKTYDNDKVKASKVITLKAEGNPLTGTSKEEQIIWLTLPKDSIGKYTHAWVTLDTLDSMNAKKASYYEAVEKAAKGNLAVIKRIDSDGKIAITFAPESGKDSYYLPEADFTYKFNVALGTVTENYDFESQVKTNPVSVKLKKQKALNTAINNKYTISAKENGEAVLSLKDKNLILTDAGTLMNKNIGGKSNQFTSYFELVKTQDAFGKDQLILRLKEGVNPKEVKGNDLNGYISSYTVSDGRRSVVVTNAAISISLKDLMLKHTLTEAGVFTNQDIATNVIFSSGGVKNPVKYVYVEEKENFTAAVDSDAEGSILLNSKDNSKIKATNKFTIYILPKDSHFVSMMASEGSEDWKVQMKEYGIKLSAVVKVKNKANTGGKIKFEGNALKIAFTADHFVPEGSSTDGVYKVKVPYTKTVDWQVESISATFREGLITIQKVPGEDAVEVTLSKEHLKEEFKKDARFYGKSFSVKVAAEFGEGTKAETFNFNIKMPTQPLTMDKVLSKIKTISGDKLTLKRQGLSGQELVAANLSAVEEEVKKQISVDGDVTYEIQGAVTESTKEKEGKLIYTVFLKENGSTKYQPTVELTLPKLYTAPSELETAVNQKIQEYKAKKITNDTKIGEILSAIRSGIRVSEYPHLRLYAKEVTYQKATIQSTGSIKGVFSLTSLVEMETPEITIEFSFTIPKLMTPQKAAEAIKTEVEKVEVATKDLSGKLRDLKVEQILKAAAEAVKGNPYGVIVKPGVNLMVPENSEKAVITLQMYYVTTQQNHMDIVCEFTVTE